MFQFSECALYNSWNIAAYCGISAAVHLVVRHVAVPGLVLVTFVWRRSFINYLPIAVLSCVYVFLSVCLCSIRSVMQKHLEKMSEVNFEKIFNQKLGTFKN